MILSDQREILLKAMYEASHEARLQAGLSPWAWKTHLTGILHGISAAGFSIVGPEATDELINRIANAIALTAGDPWFDYRPHAKAVLECLQEQSE